MWLVTSFTGTPLQLRGLRPPVDFFLYWVVIGLIVGPLFYVIYRLLIWVHRARNAPLGRCLYSLKRMAVAAEPINRRAWPDRLKGYAVGSNPAVNVCVAALLSDGLRVGPFERHGPGNSRLTALGMDQDRWRKWFERVVSGQMSADAEALWPAWQRSSQWPALPEVLHAVAQLADAVGG